ncbi:DUF3052 domain-containing protein [Ulvibacter antarcticus]|uniref:DUF3052 family protein n=1 Tax=Ulvibacter antarcticus TaxID=442714 RepID=A0A3L9Z2S2_9FLAO|nr:DUF3052 domain-containing protein [Ulvibacter antarcticus]RMA66307.1 hypothetical protein BXY75_0728 [Ulvibacter antarcticus]
MHGYSKTPLAKKLGIKEGFVISLINSPEHYFDLFEVFPNNISLENNPVTESLDFAHVFCTSFNCLEKETKRLKPLLKKTGILWVSWPKGTSKIDTEINRESIRSYVLDHIGLVDVKVAAIDVNWSALKFVYRIKDR